MRSNNSARTQITHLYRTQSAMRLSIILFCRHLFLFGILTDINRLEEPGWRLSEKLSG